MDYMILYDEFFFLFFFFKQKTAYEMRISDWSSDVCSSDLDVDGMGDGLAHAQVVQRLDRLVQVDGAELAGLEDVDDRLFVLPRILDPALLALAVDEVQLAGGESQIAAGVGEIGRAHV